MDLEKFFAVMPEGVTDTVMADQPETDAPEEKTEGEGPSFDANLAEEIDDDKLALIADELIAKYEDDEQSRAEWLETVADGLKILGVKMEDLNEPFEGACSATFPLMMEAVVQFQARAIAELFPSSGPVKTRIVGKEDREKITQAERVREFMNYQITEVMEEYYEDLDQLLFYLPIVGSCFKKVYYDKLRDRPVSMFIKPENFVVSYHNNSLRDCGRVTHVIPMDQNEFKKQVKDGFYLPIPEDDHQDEQNGPVQEEVDDIEGRQNSSRDDGEITLLEMHVDYDLPGFEEDFAVPYVITIDKQTRTVISIRRNWEDAKGYDRIQWFTHYKFLPGLGFYGFGYVHLLGNLQKSATAILRSLVDAGQFATLPGGFRARGARIKDNKTPISFGEWREVDGYGDDIRKALLPLPTKEPSQTLFAMLEMVVDAGRRLASIADINVGDTNTKETPVGTTLAMLENAVRVMSAIHKRLHNSQHTELKILARINGQNLPDSYPYAVEGATRSVKRTDFDNRIDVIPVSDPNIFSEAQRQLRAQASLQIAERFPQIHNLREAVRRMHEVLGEKNIDALVHPAQGPKPMDPATEIFAIMHSKPVMAYAWQDHEAHIHALMSAMQDPNLLGNPAAQQMFAPAVMALIADHAAHKYRLELEHEIGIKLTPPPHYDPSNPGRSDGYVPLPPELEAEVARREAAVSRQITENAQVAAKAKANAAAMQDPDTQVKFAKVQVDKMNAETKRIDVVAKHQGEAAKTQQELAKGAQEMQSEREKAQLELEILQLQLRIKQLDAAMGMHQDEERFAQKQRHGEEQHRQKMRHTEDDAVLDHQQKVIAGATDLEIQRKKGEQQLDQAEDASEQKLENSKRESEVKVQTAKAIAKAKPKKPSSNQKKA